MLALSSDERDQLEASSWRVDLLSEGALGLLSHMLALADIMDSDQREAYLIEVRRVAFACEGLDVRVTPGGFKA